MRKNNSIQLWRFVFSIVIVSLHYNIATGLCDQIGTGKGWRVAVEMFFLLSGFLLAYKLENQKHVDEVSIFKDKIRKLYPHYCFSLLVMLIVGACATGTSLVKVICADIYELLMLQNIFAGAKGFEVINDPAWYVATLILGSYLIAFLIRRYRDMYYKIVAPISVVLIYSYFIRLHGSISKWSGTTDIFGIDRLFLRGFAGISLGCMIYMLYARMSVIQWKKNASYILRLIEYLGFAFVIWFSFYHYGGYWDILIIGSYMALILISFLNQQSFGIVDNRFVSFLGKISYPVYLNQELFRRFLWPKFYPNCQWSISNWLIYVITLILYSAITMVVVEKIVNILRRIQKNICDSVKHQSV